MPRTEFIFGALGDLCRIDKTTYRVTRRNSRRSTRLHIHVRLLAPIDTEPGRVSLITARLGQTTSDAVKHDVRR